MAQISLLDALTKADVDAVDVEAIAASLAGKEFKYASHLQYALHSFCQAKKYGDAEEKIVNDVVSLCYSAGYLRHLTDMSRFAGCLHAIFIFYFERKSPDKAMEISAILQKKKDELEEASKTMASVRSSLYGCCSCLHRLISNIKVIDPLKALQLLDSCLTVLQLIKTTDEKIAKNAPSIVSYSLSLIKGHADKFAGIVRKFCSIAKILGCKTGSVTDYLTARLYCTLTSADLDSPENATNELTALLPLMDMERFAKEWTVVAEFFTTDNIEDMKLAQACINATKKIIFSAKDEKARCTLILLFFYSCKFWRCSSVDIARELCRQFLDFIHKESENIRSSCIRNGATIVMCVDVALVRAFKVAALMCRSMLKEQTEGCVELVMVLCEMFPHFWDLNIEGGEMEVYHWNNFVSTVCNSIEDVFTLCKVDPEWCYLVRICRTVAPRLATSKRKLPIAEDRLELIFYRWSYACLKMDDWKEVMLLRAVQVLVCPSAGDVAMTDWCRAKLLKENQYKSLSFMDFLKEEENELKTLCQLDLSRVDSKTLLLSEIRGYREVASDELEDVMLSVWARLRMLSLSVIEYAVGLSSVIFYHVRAASSPVVDKYASYCKKVLSSLSSLKNKSEDAACSCYYRGILKFCLILCKMRQRDFTTDTSAQHAVLGQLKEEAEENAKFGGDVDMNVTCDVAPACGALTLDHEEEIVLSLGEIADIWQELPQLWDQNMSPSEANFRLEFIRLLANIARVYDATLISARVWIIYYKISVGKMDEIGQLRALAEFIAIAEPSSESEICKLGNAIAAPFLQNGAKPSQDAIEAALTFQLNYIEILLLEGKYQSAVDSILTCNYVMGRIKNDAPYHKFRGQIMCLKTKIVLADEKLGAVLEVKSVMYAVYNGFTHLSSALEKCKNGVLGTDQLCSLLLTTLDMSLWCVEVFGTLYLTRWVRTLVEYLYQVCQNLGLTTRTSLLLAVLVQVDLTNMKLSEAQIKLNNLRKLLDKPCQEVQIKNKALLSQPNTRIKRARKPSPVRFRQARDTSPLSEMLPKEFTSPPTWDHSAACCCHFCQSCLLKLVLITSGMLEAKALAMDGKMADAQDIYQHCNQLLSQCDPSKVQTAILAELSAAGLCASANENARDIQSLCAKLAMNYAAFLMFPGVTQSMSGARGLLDNVDRILYGLSYDSFLLEWRYLELECCYLTLKERKEKPEIPTAVSTVQLLAVEVEAVPKTPCPSRKRAEDSVAAPKRETLTIDQDCSPPKFKKPARRVFADNDPGTENSTSVGKGSKGASIKASASKSQTSKRGARIIGATPSKSITSTDQNTVMGDVKKHDGKEACLSKHDIAVKSGESIVDVTPAKQESSINLKAEEGETVIVDNISMKTNPLKRGQIAREASKIPKSSVGEKESVDATIKAITSKKLKAKETGAKTDQLGLKIEETIESETKMVESTPAEASSAKRQKGKEAKAKAAAFASEVKKTKQSETVEATPAKAGTTRRQTAKETKTVELTPPTRKQPPRSAAKSIRILDTQTKRRPRVIRSMDISSDIDDDVVLPSPEMPTTSRAIRSGRRPVERTRKLQFDEAPAAQTDRDDVTVAHEIIEIKRAQSSERNKRMSDGFDSSKDLFDSFE